MTRRTLLAGLAATVLAALAGIVGPVRAEERRLDAAEIQAMLAGNRVEGVWGGRLYSQTFDPSGRTVYREQGRQPSVGRWRADPDKDAYCSWWEVSGWSCYEVWSDGPDSIIWVSPGSGNRSPAKVIRGEGS